MLGSVDLNLTHYVKFDTYELTLNMSSLGTNVNDKSYISVEIKTSDATKSSSSAAKPSGVQNVKA